MHDPLKLHSLIVYELRQGPLLKERLKLWNTLDTESWMLDTHQVPLGWKIRFDCELNQDEFLSPDMQVYRSKEAVCQLVKSASLPGEKVMAEHIRQWSQFKI